jgi:hypothetical protein
LGRKRGRFGRKKKRREEELMTASLNLKPDAP